LFLSGFWGFGVLVLVPSFMPLAASLGIDPVYLGVNIIFTLMIGTLTPPMGMVFCSWCPRAMVWRCTGTDPSHDALAHSPDHCADPDDLVSTVHHGPAQDVHALT